MIDRQKIARDIEQAGGDQRLAEAIATSIGAAVDDTRLRRVEIATAVQAAVAAIVVAMLAALLWQFVTLRGEVSAGFSQLGTRMTAVEKQLDAIQARLPAASGR